MRVRLTVLVALLALMLPSAASGAENRKQFVAKVDPVCKRVQKQAAGILGKAGDSDFRMGKAWGHVARKGRAAIADISRIGPDPRDLVLFDRWIQKLQQENVLIVRLGRSLKNGSGKSGVFKQKAKNADKRADKVVRKFGFSYCDRSPVGTP